MMIEDFKKRLSHTLLDVHLFEREKSDENVKKAADLITAKFGFKPLGDRWWDLDWDYRPYKGGQRGDPVLPLAEAIQGKMTAYSERWFSEEEAYQLAFDFYSLFSKTDLVRLSNRIGNGWNPITPYTFEAVHIAMDDKNIGLLWFGDED